MLNFDFDPSLYVELHLDDVEIKTRAILFSSSKNAQLRCPDVYFKFGTKFDRIKETESVRFLGVWLDTKFDFNDYHTKICNRCNMQ